MTEQAQAVTRKKQTEKQATRDGFGQGLLAAAEKNPQVVAVSADLTGSMRIREFAKKYPERHIQVGVAEQSLIGTAAGLALGGKKPFAASFAAFSPGRTFDQIRVSIAYSHFNVVVVGGHAGLATGPDGASHQMLEDIAMMRALPKMMVVQPCDAVQARLATLALAAQTGPAYLRLTRPKVKNVTSPDQDFQIGQAQVLKSGKDLAVIASGIVVQQALEAAKQLETEGISVRVINLHTIKPIDEHTIIEAVKQTQAVLTVEDHQIQGGMGSAAAEVIAGQLGQRIMQAKPFKTMGVKDSFGESGSHQQLYHKYGLDAAAIKQAGLRLMKQSK